MPVIVQNNILLVVAYSKKKLNILQWNLYDDIYNA